jgi:aspartokinase/homoserine dehydrogenase 1
MESMKILKFGGTSVGSADSMRAVLDIVADYQRQGIHVALVLSAMSGVTNQLLIMGKLAAQNNNDYRKKPEGN